ncbi:hypothetical protein R50072_03000 [Simiduia litorea]
MYKIVEVKMVTKNGWITFWVVALLIFSGYAKAHDFNNCGVYEVVVGADTRNAHFRMDCTVEPRPACASASNYVGFDRSTPTGAQIYSLLLTAFASGAKVSGNVNDTECPIWQGNVSLLDGSVRIVR